MTNIWLLPVLRIELCTTILYKMSASSYICIRSLNLNVFKKRANQTICLKYLTVAGVVLWNKLPNMYKTNNCFLLFKK